MYVYRYIYIYIYTRIITGAWWAGSKSRCEAQKGESPRETKTLKLEIPKYSIFNQRYNFEFVFLSM